MRCVYAGGIEGMESNAARVKGCKENPSVLAVMGARYQCLVGRKLQHFRRIDPKGCGDFADIHDCDVSLASFNPA
jgi:hypothetical protein